jgi:hypothetical protein
MSAVLTLVGYRVVGARRARGAPARRRAPAPALVATPAAATAVADERLTTVAAPAGYQPLWVRDTAPPPT